MSCSGVRYISQVKRKILDALYRQTHLSLRPANYEVDIGKDFFSFLVKKPRVFVGDFVNFFILVEGRTLLGAVWSCQIKKQHLKSQIGGSSSYFSSLWCKIVRYYIWEKSRVHFKSSYRNCKIAASFTNLLMLTIFYFIGFGFQVLTLITSIQHWITQFYKTAKKLAIPKTMSTICRRSIWCDRKWTIPSWR